MQANVLSVTLTAAVQGKQMKHFGTRKVEVLNSIIMKTTAKAINVNDIFVDVSVTSTTIIISTFAIELQ